MTTKTDIRNRVLQKLRILAAGETAVAEDAALVEDQIDEVHAELENEELVGWTIDTVPDNIASAYVAIVADRCKEDFGVEQTLLATLPGLADQAMTRLRRQTSPGWSGDATEAEYF